MPELVAQATCRHNGCPNPTHRGFVLCPTHETTWTADRTTEPPEGDTRQFVRYAYAEDCKLPYRPADLEPKPRPRGEQAPIDKVLSALHSAGCAYRPAPNDVDSWQAQCPTHPDSRPSLAVRRNHEGTLWLRCWSGCSKEGILAALGLEWRDLWDGSHHDTGRRSVFVKPLLPAHLRRALEDALRLDDERRAA